MAGLTRIMTDVHEQEARTVRHTRTVTDVHGHVHDHVLVDVDVHVPVRSDSGRRR
jgi:hypothetical protein